MKLNTEQKKAAEHVEGPLLVLAGAGSGKTRVVAERICHLISLGVLPEKILAVTFTNKAAREMQRRIISPYGKKPLICTFHSLGAKILREKIHFLGYKNNFSIYDEEDAAKLLKACLKNLSLDNSFKEMRFLISQAKNDLDFSNSLKTLEQQKQENFCRLFDLYQKKLKEYNAVDFDDLLYLTVQLLRTYEEALKNYQRRWQFLLIDEYQDTNHAQHELSKLLSGGHKNIFAVGDPDQSIYSWRGARYKNILNFETTFPGAKTIALEQNYRSTNCILKAANALICNNENRKPKELFSNLGEGEKISLILLDSEKEEALFIVQKILKLQREAGKSLNDMVIFYRTNAQSRIFEDLLLASRIPYVIYGGISFYQRKEIKDVLAYLKLIASDSDFLAFARTINLPRRGIGERSLNKLLYLAEKKDMPLLQLLKQILKNDETCGIKFSPKQQKVLQAYLELIQNLRKKVQNNLPLAEIISDILEKSGYLQHLQEDKEKFAERKENIDELIAKAAEYEDGKKHSSLMSFLEEISLLTSTDLKESSQEVLKLMSLHNGKGLEFDTVFITGLEEDLFPHINSKGSPEKLEEERRLFYVGMTRAQKKLFLTAAAYRFLFGSSRIMYPSRFLAEIPEEALEKEDQIYGFGIYSGKKSRRTEQDENVYLFEKSSEKEAEFAVGDIVQHASFGLGIVEKVSNSSFGLTYDVFFKEENIRRTLAAKYAGLRPPSTT